MHFASAVDDACDQLSARLQRELHSDEVEALEDELLLDWIQAERFDGLIDHALEEFELRDGEAFCASLGQALAGKNDRARCERLFLGLADAREAAFRRTWPAAQEGNVGAMKESAMHLARALDALAGLYRCYSQLDDDTGKEATQAAMLRLQSRAVPPDTQGRRRK
jgi:hypothetical protein